jgi:hypothetical protein
MPRNSSVLQPQSVPNIRVFEILSLTRILPLLIGGGSNEIGHQIAVRRVCSCWNYHPAHPALLALPSMFRSHGMRAELRQGRGLVGNMAGVLVDPTDMAALKSRIYFPQQLNGSLHSRIPIHGSAGTIKPSDQSQSSY